MKQSVLKCALLSITAVAVLAGCENVKKSTDPAQSGWEQMELRGKVKSITEINHTIVSPESMAFGDGNFADVCFLDYYMYLQAACEANGIDIEDVLVGKCDEPEEFDFYGEGNEDEGFAYTVYQFDENGDLERKLCYLETMNDAPSDQEVNTYDNKHQLLRTEHFNPDLTLAFFREYAYNADGFVTREYYCPSQGDTFEDIFEYDANNNNTRYIGYINGEVSFERTTEYSSSGQELVEICQSEGYYNKWEFDYFPSGKCKGKERERRRYVEGGRLENSQHIVYSADMSERWEVYLDGKGDTIALYYYQIDTDGNDIYEEYYEYGNENPSTVSQWAYDKRGNMTHYEWQGKERTEYTSMDFEYDNKGRETAYTWFSLDQGAVLTRVETSYDANGRIRTEDTYLQVVNVEDPDDSTDEELTKHEVYYFDTHDNWIKREVYKTDTNDELLLMKMQTREIAYFE